MADVGIHTETERKFLVLSDAFKAQATASHRMKQGYIARDNGNSVRVRIKDNTGILTIKGPSADDISRTEWEIEIPLQDAEALLRLCHGGIIDKTRYIIPEGVPPSGRVFEVDVFHGDNEGLVMAEIELDFPDQPFEKPSWLGQEVTGNRHYYNSYLSLHPYKNW